MGSGIYSASVYDRNTARKIASGTTFEYNRSGATTAHETLDPAKVLGKTGIIESRDSVEHPNSVPIILGFDQTGSMSAVPGQLQTKLKDVFTRILDKGYVEDPQISIAAYGDMLCDPIHTSLQFSQFESDNRIDDNLDNLILFGGGGANGGETMTGIWYMMTKVRHDAWEKRGKRGYAFLIADEIALDLPAASLKEVTGEDEVGPTTVRELAKMVQEQWDVKILLVNNASARMQGSLEFYSKLFGTDNVLVLEGTDHIAETISLAIGVAEGTINADEGADDLRASGVSEKIIGKTLATVTKGEISRPSRGGTAVATGDLGLDL